MKWKWSDLTPEEQWDALAAAPLLASAWAPYGHDGESRHRSLPSGETIVLVRPKIRSDFRGWGIQWDFDDEEDRRLSGRFATREEALRAADGHLQKMGYTLMLSDEARAILNAYESA